MEMNNMAATYHGKVITVVPNHRRVVRVPDATFKSVEEAKPFYIYWANQIAKDFMDDPNYEVKVIFSEACASRNVGRCHYTRDTIRIQTKFMESNLDNPVFPRHIISHEIIHLKFRDHGKDFLYHNLLYVEENEMEVNDNQIVKPSAYQQPPVAILKCNGCGREKKLYFKRDANHIAWKCGCGSTSHTMIRLRATVGRPRIYKVPLSLDTKSKMNIEYIEGNYIHKE